METPISADIKWMNRWIESIRFLEKAGEIQDKETFRDVSQILIWNDMDLDEAVVHDLQVSRKFTFKAMN